MRADCVTCEGSDGTPAVAKRPPYPLLGVLLIRHISLWYIRLFPVTMTLVSVTQSARVVCNFVSMLFYDVNFAVLQGTSDDSPDLRR